ncbi:glycoside hydrolase family 28 protein [Granulicella rosea]|nr:glycosyl hydrolase family 28 protein [Granulicella rosea]
MNRRTLLAKAGSASLLAAFAPGGDISALTASGKTGLLIADPRSRGARGDAKSNDRNAIQESIDECAAAGGGIVYIAPGIYLSGMLLLKSNVTLYLDAGATILGSKNIDDYPPQSGPDAHADAGVRHLIAARKADNIAICGHGTIDGQGPSFWKQNGTPAPTEDNLWRSVITWEWEALPRPSPMIELIECTNVRIEGITLKDAPGWTLRPIACNSVFIRGIRIRNHINGVNTDGIDVTCSQNVLISDCDISSADDAICIKSENPYGPLELTRNITVTNCILTGCCNGFKIGTATRGGIENITFSNSIIENRDVPYNQRLEGGIVIEMVDGGWLEGITITGIRMQRARVPIFIRRGNRTPRPDGTPGYLRGVMIDGVHASGAIVTSSITGIPGFPVEDVTLSNIRIDSEEHGKEAWARAEVPEREQEYPKSLMFGRLPAAGLYCRHVADLRLHGIDLRLTASEERPALICDDAGHIDVSGFRSTSISGKQPVVLLNASRNVWLRDGRAPEQTDCYLEVRGKQSAGIVLSHSDLINVRQTTVTTGGAAENAVTQSFNILRAASAG